MLKRGGVLLYGVVAYALFLGAFLYTAGWLANAVVPKTIDSGPARPALAAIAIDLSLLSAFALQHSVMARPAFKRWWTARISPSVERSTYVIASSLFLHAICVFWQPLPCVLWRVEGAAAGALWLLWGLGWVMMVVSTFLISHWHFVGLEQTWSYWRGRKASTPVFLERVFYRLVRHPIMLGFFMVFWITPRMTRGHLLFAATATVYILIGVSLEERDLLAEHGQAYRAYQTRVPKFLPRPW